MKILIVEDDQNKSGQIEAFIHEIYPDSWVQIASSFRSGFVEIEKGGWDWILLDMQLPTFDRTPTESGGRQRALAGVEILRKMQLNKLPGRVIVVTQFERFGEGSQLMSLSELIKKLSAGNYPNYAGTVYYNATMSDWKEKLGKQLK